jgi:hypothetical protein
VGSHGARGARGPWGRPRRRNCHCPPCPWMMKFAAASKSYGRQALCVDLHGAAARRTDTNMCGRGRNVAGTKRFGRHRHRRQRRPAAACNSQQYARGHTRGAIRAHHVQGVRAGVLTAQQRLPVPPTAPLRLSGGTFRGSLLSSSSARVRVSSSGMSAGVPPALCVVAGVAPSL